MTDLSEQDLYEDAVLPDDLFDNPEEIAEDFVSDKLPEHEGGEDDWRGDEHLTARTLALTQHTFEHNGDWVSWEDALQIPDHLDNHGHRGKHMPVSVPFGFRSWAEWSRGGAPTHSRSEPLHGQEMASFALVLTEGYGIDDQYRSGETPGPRRERDEERLTQALERALQDRGIESILEAQALTGNGRKTPPDVMAAFVDVAEKGLYAEIHRLFGPSPRTLKNWRRTVAALPPVDLAPDRMSSGGENT